MVAQNKEGYRYVCSMHAIGQGVQTRNVALALRAGAVKTEISSTRDTFSTSRREFGFYSRIHATLGPRTELELADRAAVYFEQPDCSKAALPLVRVRTRR